MTKKESTPPEAAITPKPAPKAASKQLGSLNWIALAILAIALGYTIYASLESLKPVVPSDDTAASTDTQTVVLPTLQLHENHQRQGPDITVNTDNIGKENPFSK
jgi:hypothetical protein